METRSQQPITMMNPDVKYKDSVVAFLDILGFKFIVGNSQKDEQKRSSLVKSLVVCGNFKAGIEKQTTSGPVPMQTRNFSDNVVFFTEKKRQNITQLFFLVRYLQDRLWEQGLCLRGAITLGGMYWPDSNNNITLGPGLIEAYKLEQEIAIYPRIIITKELFDYIGDQYESFPFGRRQRKMKDLICRDKDGMYFLDLLNENITRVCREQLENAHDGTFSVHWIEANDSNYNQICTKVNKTIQQNINSEDVKVRQKYEWLKSYMDKKNPPSQNICKEDSNAS